MRQVCQSARPEHLKQFEFGEIKIPVKGERRQRSLWDWEVYPLAGPDGKVTHLLNVVMNVSASAPTPRRQSGDDREAENRRREAASGVIRIFGVAPEPSAQPGTEQLSRREQEVAELMALGFTNAAIARRLNVTAATVSSHVAHILAKLGYRSRAQVAAWVVARRLRKAESSSASVDSS